MKLADATTDGAGCALRATGFDRDWVACAPRTPLLDGFAGADGVTLAVAGLTDPVVVHAWNPQPPRPDAICQVGLRIFADMILAFPRDVPAVLACFHQALAPT